MVMDHFQDSAPDVYQSQTGDGAAHKAAVQHPLQRRPTRDESGREPVAGPGQHHQPQAQDHAEQDIRGREDPLQPHRRVGVFVKRLGTCWSHEIRGSELQDAGT